MKYLAASILGISIFAAACEDPAANKVKATVNDPRASQPATFTGNANTSTASAVPKGEALAITPETSKLEFTGSKVTGKHDGGFKPFTGTIDLVNNKPTDSGVNVDIDTASVFSDDEKLTGHLKSKDFFDVEAFPKASFHSTRIEPDTAKGPDAYTVTGDFTLHGVTKSITFPAHIKVSDASVDVDSEFSVNRKDFGIVYAGKADDLIRDDVVIRLNLKTARKK